MKFAHTVLVSALALTGATTAAAPSFAQNYGYQAPSYGYQAPGYGYQPPAYGYQAPGYTYTRPPRSYRPPPPYSYQSPDYTYQPPDYSYTPPGFRRPYEGLNSPDYNQAYPHSPSAYDAAYERRWHRGNRDPVYNRFGNPRNPTDVWNAAPPYRSESESR